MEYSKKEQVEMLRMYPPRISRKRVRQNVNEGEEDESWNEDSPAKRMHRLVSTLFLMYLLHKNTVRMWFILDEEL